MNLHRRDLFKVLLGAHASTWLGCQRPSASLEGKLLRPGIDLGHQVRDQRFANVAADNKEAARVVIVGGGIAGLSAAWRFKQAGFDDFVLLELDGVVGGTSQSSQRGAIAYPWGAHYVPTPMKEQRGLISLLKEMQVIVGEDATGEPQVKETYLCRAPQERVYVEGEWIEGLYPEVGATAADLSQLSKFRHLMDEWAGRTDALGRRYFAIPMAAGSDCKEIRALDKLSMHEWMQQQGLDSPRLHWLVDHSCRDDYGLSVEHTSAWAGIFYFASRSRSAEQSYQDVITWPAGNGFVVKHLAARVQPSIRRQHAVIRIESGASACHVLAWDGNTNQASSLRSEQVLFAAPQYLAPYLITDLPRDRVNAAKSFQYGAWVVANVAIRERPQERGGLMCWDNVIYNSQSLGYVSAAHQTGIDHGSNVLTWYYPLTDQAGKVSRQQLLGMNWRDWADLVIADLQYPHPDLPDLITHIDVMQWGHAMIQPRPGFVWSDQRQLAQLPLGRIHFAHTDLSGIALLEEAFYHGVRAAEAILQTTGVDKETIL